MNMNTLENVIAVAGIEVYREAYVSSSKFCDSIAVLQDKTEKGLDTSIAREIAENRKVKAFYKIMTLQSKSHILPRHYDLPNGRKNLIASSEVTALIFDAFDVMDAMVREASI